MKARPGCGSPAGAGFTLAELAIALVIVGLLLASAFIPLSAQIEFAPSRTPSGPWTGSGKP